MSNQFQFTVSEYEVMQETAKRIEDNLSELRKISDMLSKDVVPSLGLYWTGEAKDVFEAKYRVLDHLIQDILISYDELNQDLVKAADAYLNAEIESHYLVNHWR